MVFPTVSYSTKINAKFSASKKFKLSTPRVGPRSAPDIYDRISAYDRAFHKCMQKDSKLIQWRQRMERKGLPDPLREGYQRSSSSWQHSLSSLSSGASTCSNESYTLHRTKNVYDIKPMRSITTTTTTTTACPPPLVAPSPRPSVSRRIINRLSKVTPSATQSLRRTTRMNPSPRKTAGPPCSIEDYFIQKRGLGI